MKIALFGKTFNQGFRPYIGELMRILEDNHSEVMIYKPFYDFICYETGDEPKECGTFSGYDDFDGSCELMISIGGDGTFLATIPFAIPHNLPVIGINSGRLGFLANISKENIKDAFKCIFSGRFDYEFRTLICFKQPEDIFNGMNFALNDITFHTSDSSLITIDAYINDEFLNTYWTDGLIISTPTGSTAYSLSVGGPIVVPGSDNLIIAPISSHNLTVRPLIIPDTSVISLHVNSRSGRYSIASDNRVFMVENRKEPFKIGKSEHNLKMLKLPNTSFYTTLRNKLKWGEDVRN
jgi:NAD+ kinase